MRRGQLADLFVGVGAKRLAAVDADPERSNQHEVNTTRKMRDEFLGQVHQEKIVTVYIWLGEDQDAFTVESVATHYDARLNIPKRSEWRLYYPTNPVTEAMRGGDTLFLAKDRNGRLYFIVTPQGSTGEQQLIWLFGVRPQEDGQFVSRELSDKGPELDFAARFILDEIGVEYEEPDADRLDSIVERFGMSYPPTIDLADVARLTLPEVRAEDDPDAALMAWIDHETALFYRLEHHIIAARLEKGFVGKDGLDVDGFLSFSLSVHQRRRSRMGSSLEHHLDAVFRACSIAYVRNAETENNHQPDFLFPSAEAYRLAPVDGDPRLTMLGAKSSCKDRWRQVLAEAEKIPRKHLLTLQPGISENQTRQMQASNLQLVVPTSVQHSYTPHQQSWLWSLDAFITEVGNRQMKFG